MSGLIKATSKTSLILVNMIRDTVVPKMQSLMLTNDATKDMTLNYQYGRSIQILTENVKIADASKYPLFALYTPIQEDYGTAGYVSVTIQKLILAYYTDKEKSPSERYTDVFLPILYPLYEYLKISLCSAPFVIDKDIDSLNHSKFDIHGLSPVEGTTQDYCDYIQINNLKFKVKI